MDLQVVIVDNASKDGTAEFLSRSYPQVELIRNDKNLGFAKAVNQGIKISRGKYILLLNPDMRVLGRAVLNSLEFVKKNKEVGIIGGQYLYPNYKIQSSFGNFPSLLTEFLQATSLYKILPFGRYVPYNVLWKKWFKKIMEVDWVAGGFMLARKEVIESIGLFDENFFMYLEDIDFCRRARDKNFEIVYYPKARIIHHHMASAEDLSLTLLNEVNSLVYYFEKHNKKDISILKFFIYLRFYIRIVRYFISALFAERDREMLRAYKEALFKLNI
jgi:hypothetical protein